MNYLLMEILLYLLIAGVIGFVIGWLFRGGCKKKTLDNNEKVSVKESSEKEIESDSKESSNNLNDTAVLVDEKEPVVPETIEVKESAEPELLKEARDGKKDNLSLIKGIGKVLEGKLNDLGIYHLDQIAAWSKEQQMWVDVNMSFKGRVEREAWVNQAKELLLVK